MAVTLFLLVTDGRCFPPTSSPLFGFVIFVCHFTSSNHGKNKNHRAHEQQDVDLRPRRRPRRRSSHQKKQQACIYIRPTQR